MGNKIEELRMSNIFMELRTKINAGVTYIEIPAGVTKIPVCTFYSCKNLVSVIIPNSVTFIDSYAFSDCINLESIVIPDSVKFIGYNIFYECENLKELYIPEHLIPQLSHSDREIYDKIYLKKWNEEIDNLIDG